MGKLSDLYGARPVNYKIVHTIRRRDMPRALIVSLVSNQVVVSAWPDADSCGVFCLPKIPMISLTRIRYRRTNATVARDGQCKASLKMSCVDKEPPSDGEFDTGAQSTLIRAGARRGCRVGGCLHVSGWDAIAVVTKSARNLPYDYNFRAVRYGNVMQSMQVTREPGTFRYVRLRSRRTVLHVTLGECVTVEGGMERLKASWFLGPTKRQL